MLIFFWNMSWDWPPARNADLGAGGPGFGIRAEVTHSFAMWAQQGGGRRGIDPQQPKSVS